MVDSPFLTRQIDSHVDNTGQGLQDRGDVSHSRAAGHTLNSESGDQEAALG